MKNKFIKQDKYILESFLKNSIPKEIKWENVNEWDLMECYEELFNYSHSLLDGDKIDLNINSFGAGKSIIFNQEYKSILYELSKNANIDLRIHCYLSLATLSVLEKYTKNK